MNIPLLIISGIILLPSFSMFLLLEYRLWSLERKFKILKNKLQKTQKMCSRLNQAIDEALDSNKIISVDKQVIQELKLIFPDIKEMASHQSVKKIFSLQNALLDLEHESSFEPQFWWPKVYVKRLITIKSETKKLLDDVRIFYTEL